MIKSTCGCGSSILQFIIGVYYGLKWWWWFGQYKWLVEEVCLNGQEDDFVITDEIKTYIERSREMYMSRTQFTLFVTLINLEWIEGSSKLYEVFKSGPMKNYIKMGLLKFNIVFNVDNTVHIKTFSLEIEKIGIDKRCTSWWVISIYCEQMGIEP